MADASTDGDGREPVAGFVLAAVVIEGGTVFEAADLASSYQSYLARRITSTDMAAIAESVTQTYRNAGYVLSRAVVPPQSGAGGILRLQIAEGFIVGVDVTGPGRDAVLRRFEPVVQERPLRLATLERALALVDDLAGLSIAKSALVPDTDDLTTYRLVIETSEDRWEAWAYADNRGVGPAGDAQAYLSGSLNGALRAGDRVSVGLFTAPENPQDLIFAEAGYALPISASGTTLSAYGSHSRADVADPVLPETHSESRRVLVQIVHPFIRGRSFTLRGDAGLEHRSLQERSGGAMSFEDELRIVELGATMAAGTTSLDVRLRAGLDAFGASTGATGPLSRPGADGEFVQLRLFASHYRAIGDRWGVYAAANGQASSDPVLATEEFTFGGAQFGRGYDYGWLAGDDGAAAMIELRYGDDPNWSGLDFYQLYGFYDAGWTWSHADAAYLAYGHASSTGLGLRLTPAGDLRLTVEAAKPLTRRWNETSDDGWRGWVSLSASF